MLDLIICETQFENNTRDSNFDVGVFSEFLADGAHDPVNVDCRVAEIVKKKVETSPDRYCFQEAEVRGWAELGGWFF